MKHTQAFELKTRGRPLRVLVACEESQIVTKEFRRLGHHAFSCDLQDCSGGHPEWHIKKDAIRAMWDGEPYFGMPWDLLIGHPPCTYLSRVGIRWIDRPCRKELRDEAISFFRNLWCGPVPKVCLENPVPMKYVTDNIGYWDQKIQPYYFGDSEVKTTCLWLKGLPKLNGLLHVGASKTFPGIARAMAEQWSSYLCGGVFNSNAPTLNFDKNT